MKVIMTDECATNDTNEHKILLETQPLSKSDFERWGKWLQFNTGRMLSYVAKHIKNFHLESLANLTQQGWQPTPDYQRMYEQQKNKKTIRLNEEMIKSLVQNLNNTPIMLIRQKSDASDNIDGIAVYLPTHEILDWIRSHPLDHLQQEGKSVEFIAFVEKVLLWLLNELSTVRNGHIYLVLDMQSLLSLHLDILEWFIDGAINSFDDRGVKDFLDVLKESIIQQVKGDLVNWQDVLNLIRNQKSSER